MGRKGGEEVMIFRVICEAIGMGVIAGVVAFLFFGLFTIVKEVFHKIRVHYKAKHRFDKPPIAKCYCVDCAHFIKERHECWYNKWSHDDNHFCAWAEPKL